MWNNFQQFVYNFVVKYKADLYCLALILFFVMLGILLLSDFIGQIWILFVVPFIIVESMLLILTVTIDTIESNRIDEEIRIHRQRELERERNRKVT